jgi:hypothetical protein
MNNWNFNELTQEDILDYKACQRKDKSIYGIPDKSECTKGKEIKTEDLQKLAVKANAGDKSAKAQIDQYNKVQEEQKSKARKEKQAKAEAEKKKKAEAEAAKKGKKGKGGGKGKKGGGKGKAGGKGGGKGAGKAKGGKGGGAAAKGGGDKSQLQANAKKAQQQAQKRRNERARDIRSRIGELQKSLRQIKDPEVRKALEQQISDALRSVSDLGKGISSSPDAGKPAAPSAPAKPGKAADGAQGIGAAA